MTLCKIAPSASMLAVREGINGNLEQLEAELALKGAWVWGSYVGNGWESREIELGFAPAVVLVVDDDGTMRDGSYTFGGLALRGGASRGVAVTDNGFTVCDKSYIITNNSGSSYYYLALR